MPQRPHSSSSRRRSLDRDEHSVSVPFHDGDPSEGELPLAELDEFVIPGSDDKGRKSTVSCNIPPLLDRQIDIILQSRRFPYANKKDLMRHAIARHCGWLTEIRQTVPHHHMAMYESLMEVVRDDEYTMRQEQVFLTIGERIGDHINKGETQEASRLITVVDQKLKKLKPSMWVRRFAEIFYGRYGSWLKVNVTNIGEKKKAVAE